MAVWHRFMPPPWGGGNQFMLALRGALQARGVVVCEGGTGERADVHLLNAIHFEVDRFLAVMARRPATPVVHRIDGPIQLARGQREADEQCFALNARFATTTVLQSAWTCRQLVAMGYQPVHPVIVHNAVDPGIFHRRGRTAPPARRPVRLISSSWSDNPLKGGPTYRWLDAHLDFDRYAYTFVGRIAERLHHIRVVPPVGPGRLAGLLRRHDVYVTASRNDACSNALIEALACGLPALYVRDGGHPELVGPAGLAFDEPRQIPALLERLVEHYAAFQNLAVAPALDTVAETYLTLLREAAAGR